MGEVYQLLNGKTISTYEASKDIFKRITAYS